jgi:MFS transporter, LPLT family, lysophospholipid transporter
LQSGVVPTSAHVSPAAAPRQGSGFARLVAAQTLSALADNALLLVAMAQLAERGLAAWWAPLLKLAYVLAYVLLAPWVGAWADRHEPRRLLLAMAGLKVLGLALLGSGTHPLLAMALVGAGAAASAPARYGWVSERLPVPRLVAANAWLEGTMVCATIAGIGLGGLLVGPAGLGLPVATAALLALQGLGAVLLLGLADVRVPGAPPRARQPQRFRHDLKVLWRDADAALSLALTALFWGAAAVLQIAVLQWAAVALALPLHQASLLPLAVGLGIVAGAAWAGRHVPLSAVRRLLPLGLVMGLGVAATPWVSGVGVALAAMLLLGALGGALVVPMNALLQRRGHELLSTGRSIAVQNAAENASILLALALQAGLLAAGVPVTLLLSLLGLAVAGGVALLMRTPARPGPSA